jgi:tetratricopeptide (TPR) repeat protein
VKPDRYARIKELVLRVTDLQENERKDFLDEACKDDPELRSEVESYLAHEEDRHKILKTGGAIPSDLKKSPDTVDTIDHTLTCWRLESLNDYKNTTDITPETAGNWPDEDSRVAAGYLHGIGVELPWGYGDEFGNKDYRVIGLRSGGLGVVLIVESSHNNEARTYAAKTLHSFLRSDYLDMPNHVQEILCTAFLEEALPWLEMDQHPHIVAVQLLKNILHPKLDRQIPFIFSEFMPKGSLRSYFKARGNLSIKEALTIGIHLCEGLLHAYRFSLDAHRDIKPENILVHEENVYMVTDFSANVFGTPGYMAPEQVAAWWRKKGKSLTTEESPIDHRVDQFAIGLVMLEALLGVLPIPAWTDSVKDRKQAQKFINQRAFEIDDHQILEPLKNIVYRLLSPVPEDRYPAPSDLRDNLVSIYEEEFGTYLSPEVAMDDSGERWYGRGQAFETLSRPAAAEASFKNALKRYGKIPGSEINQAWCQLSLGKVNSLMGLYREAERAVNKAWEIFSNFSENRLDLADCLMVQGSIFIFSGRYPEAEKAYDEAMEIIESNSGTKLQQNRCISNRGIVYSYMDHYNEAEQAFRESLKLCQQIPGSELEQAKSLVNLGSVYNEKGLFSKAIESFEEGMKILYQIPATEHVRATCKMSMGNALNWIGRYSEAVEVLNEARSIYQQIPGTEVDQATCAMNLGIVYMGENRYEEARESIHEALKIYRDFPGTEFQQAECLQNLGSILCEEERFNNAKEKIVEALKIFQKIPGAEHSKANCTVELATIYRKTGYLGKAETACNEAMEIYCGIPATEFYQAACAAELALIHQEKDDLTKARQFAREAIDFCKPIPPEATTDIRSISKKILGEEGKAK